MIASPDSSFQSVNSRDLVRSLILHIAILGGLYLLALGLSGIKIAPSPAPTPVRIVEKVTELPPATDVPKPVDIRKPVPEPMKPKQPPAFGINRNTLTNEGSGVQVKSGNTLAKEVDKVEAENDLPIAVEEFLVTKMPRLRKELRIPYPEEAKAARIEGPVVMDILVDDQGRVRDAVLVNGPAESLSAAALAAVKSFEFDPAQVDGKSVAVRIRYIYRFVLTD